MLRPAHLGDGSALDALLDLDEGAVVGQETTLPVTFVLTGYFSCFPRMREELLEAEEMRRFASSKSRTATLMVWSASPLRRVVDASQEGR